LPKSIVPDVEAELEAMAEAVPDVMDEPAVDDAEDEDGTAV